MSSKRAEMCKMLTDSFDMKNIFCNLHLIQSASNSETQYENIHNLSFKLHMISKYVLSTSVLESKLHYATEIYVFRNNE